MTTARCLLAGLALVATAALLTPATQAQTVIPGGNIVNQTWTPAASPYIVQGDLTVPAGAFLTIQAGVVVEPASNRDATGGGANTARTETSWWVT